MNEHLIKPEEPNIIDHVFGKRSKSVATTRNTNVLATSDSYKNPALKDPENREVIYSNIHEGFHQYNFDNFQGNKKIIMN